MDVIVTATDEGKTWTLADLLGRSMGSIEETSADHFTIRPVGKLREPFAGMKYGPYSSLDAALAEIETHTRGVCRRAFSENKA